MGVLTSIGVFDYNGKKLCDLYDSQVHLDGQAYGISFAKNWDGIPTLSFTIPYRVEKEKNFRWKYMRSEYMIRMVRNGKTEEFIAEKPVKSKSGKEIVGTVTCNGSAIMLKTKNIYKVFDDENGVGTVEYLLDEILKGTGWHRGTCDRMLERDGVTERIRSLKSDGKQGALGLINTLCNLFRCRPEYDSEHKLVNLYALSNRSELGSAIHSLEVEVGRNLDSIAANYDSNDIVTRLYVEGDYTDDGYIGIDDVNPTGLNYLFNFDYYREIGLFGSNHEAAYTTYMEEIQDVNSRIKANQRELNEWEGDMNDLMGQCMLAVYYPSQGYTNPVYTYGDPPEAKRKLWVGDEVAILSNDGKYRYETIETTIGALIKPGDYAVVKFVTKASGIIGGREVQIEAKELQIKNLRKKIEETEKADKIAEYEAEIEQLEEEIRAIKEDARTADKDTKDTLSKTYIPTDYNGNADLVNRIIVPGATMRAAGWSSFTDAMYATLNTQSYVKTIGGAKYVVSMTPILQDGSVVSGATLAEYLDGLITTAQTTGVSIMDVDTANLLLRVDAVKDSETEEYAVERNGRWVTALEDLQRMWNSVRAKYDWFGEEGMDPGGYFEDIRRLYTGSLYSLMASVMSGRGVLYMIDTLTKARDVLIDEQSDIEATFVAAMGNLLRDGYWANKNYIPGQEQALYEDALIMSEEMGKPKVTYSINYIRIADKEKDVPIDDLLINQIVRMNDEELEIHDNLFIKKIMIGVDNEMEGSLEVSNQDLTISGNDLGSILSRISQLSDLIEQKNALYERAKAISSSGTFYANRLNGQIDVLKNQLLSTVSNWYTDEKGNIMFLAADGQSAMMLCGAGFMIANSKSDDGSWNWRSFGTGA